MIAPEIFTFPDAQALARAAAEEVVQVLRAALAARGEASLVLAGGSTPRPLYQRLAESHAGALDWGRVSVFLGDERFVPPEDERSNFRLASETLLGRLGFEAGRVHAVPTGAASPAEAARAYEATLREHLGPEPAFDLVLLGIGEDGHTASLFPGSPALEERERWVVAAEAPPGAPVRERITLTLPALSAGRTVLFLAAGEGKRAAIEDALRDPKATPPAQRVGARERLLWFLDEAAYGEDALRSSPGPVEG